MQDNTKKIDKRTKQSIIAFPVVKPGFTRYMGKKRATAKSITGGFLTMNNLLRYPQYQLLSSHAKLLLLCILMSDRGVLKGGTYTYELWYSAIITSDKGYPDEEKTYQAFEELKNAGFVYFKGKNVHDIALRQFTSYVIRTKVANYLFDEFQKNIDSVRCSKSLMDLIHNIDKVRAKEKAMLSTSINKH